LLDCYIKFICYDSNYKTRAGHNLPDYSIQNIALLAKQSATLQEISNGRLEFRTGAGATHNYATQWWYPFGIGYPNAGERISLLDEGLEVLRLLWSKPEVHFSGKYFKINGARLENPDTPVSITVAAKRRKMMQLAAKHADIWESSYLSPEQFVSINSEFEKISNPTKMFVKSIELDVIIANSDSEVEYKKRLFAVERGPAVLSHLLKHSLVGKPEDIAQKVKKYIDAGIDQFFLAFQDPFEYEAIQLFMSTMKGIM
jgi:alkanesulfonate monooxygenase SsuD/methylene tetrahydromethanopterin reductase-like flavin-dependent oxidoreductase (luciferase family)